MTNQPEMSELSGAHAAYTIARAMAQATPTVALSPPAAELLPPPAAKLLRPNRLRLFGVPVIVFGFTALLAVYGINRQPVERPKPQPQTKAADDPATPKQQGSRSVEVTPLADPSPEQPVKPAEPFRSLALDAAQSYLASRKTR